MARRRARFIDGPWRYDLLGNKPVGRRDAGAIEKMQLKQPLRFSKQSAHPQKVRAFLFVRSGR